MVLISADLQSQYRYLSFYPVFSRRKDVVMNTSSSRTGDHSVDSIFIERWSPRSFKHTALTSEQVLRLFEAARWAPSCHNDQPWRFHYAVSETARRCFIDTLVPGNRVWAVHAPLLIYITAGTCFRHNGKSNAWAAFDAGAAWMSIALQARLMGLYTHGMAGFERDRAIQLLNIDTKTEDVLAAVAVGYRGDRAMLPEMLQEKEQPNGRLPLDEIIREITSCNKS